MRNNLVVRSPSKSLAPITTAHGNTPTREGLTDHVYINIYVCFVKLWGRQDAQASSVTFGWGFATLFQTFEGLDDVKDMQAEVRAAREALDYEET